MANIPDRENLESMSRTDIQKLCKDNNIKANMRTDEMINALCDMVNGKDVPRPHRSMSERVVSQPPRSRLGSVQPSSKTTTGISAKKTALHPSESNTDAESVADAPSSARTTRRKAKDIQSRLGKGRPVLAGGSGARKITKVISRGRKGKTSAMLQEDPILEEEEHLEVSTGQPIESSKTNPAMRPTSVRPLSPTTDAPADMCDNDHPSQLPTPAPSHPSYSLPSAQFTALESRVNQLEVPNLAARLSQVEAALTDIAILKASVAQLPALQEEITRLGTVQRNLESELEQWAKSHAELKVRATTLEVHVKGLVVENDGLKECVKELETKLHRLEGAPEDSSTSSVVLHSPKATISEGTLEDVEKGKGVEKEAAVGAAPATIAKRIVYSMDPDLPAPSPSQPVLGKRARSPTETPDVSLSEIPADATKKQREDAELAAIYRVTRPQRKKARLAIDPDEDAPPFSFFLPGRGGPASTSTPQQRRSESPPGFFTAGRRAPTPLARAEDDMSLDVVDFAVQEVDAESNAVAGPSSLRAPSPVNVAPQTPPSKLLGAGPSTDAGNTRGAVDPVYDPGFFGGPLPVYYTQSSQLPFPLQPTTPLNPQVILERSTQLATPILGEPWKFDANVNTAGVSQSGGGAAEPATPGSVRSFASSSNAVPPQSPGDYAFRAGGRKERNDKYNPYFTPQRGPGARHRSGITPTRAFSLALKSPVKMTTVVEAPEAEKDEDAARSPPHLRTLYGTELTRDGRFGDYGRNLGRYDWGKYVPR